MTSLLNKTEEQIENYLRRMHEANQAQYRVKPPEVTVESLTTVSPSEMTKILHMIGWQEQEPNK